jgi:uncharacterized protein YdeI (YjbR/CyaY-like superfamily)
MIKTENFEQVVVENQAALREWLLEHHQQEASVWLVTYKKSEKEKYVSREEVLDELLCFGWIDGIRRKRDEKTSMQLIAPRKTQHWAKSYKERAAKLIENGKMHAAGQASIERGKASGLWHFMDDVDALILPEDLKSALKALPSAATFFDSINPSSKRFVLRWIKLAKTEKTRKSRILKIAQLSAKGEKLPGS